MNSNIDMINSNSISWNFRTTFILRLNVEIKQKTAPLRLFAQSKLWCKPQKNGFSNLVLLLCRWKISDWDLVERIETCVFEKSWLHHQGKLTLIALLVFSQGWDHGRTSSKRSIFEVKVYFFDPGKTKEVKKNWYPKTEKKVYLYTSKVGSSKRFLNFWLFYQLFLPDRNFFLIFEKLS